MKSFSVKALALTALVISSSVNADIIDTIKDYVKTADRALFGRCVVKKRVEGGIPIFNSYLHCENGYARAAVVVVTIIGIYKIYRYLTAPSAEANKDKNTAS